MTTTSYPPESRRSDSELRTSWARERSELAGEQQRPKRDRLVHEPPPASPPGTLVIENTNRPRIFVIDYDADVVSEKEIQSVEECIPYLTDDRPSITWVDVRGLGHKPTFERLGEIFKIHPLALEDMVNVPQRPKADVYGGEHVLVISRMAQVTEHCALRTEQLAILFGKSFVLTVQEEAEWDVMGVVRERIRAGKGTVRTRGADYLAYALLDAVVDGFFPVLERLGDHIEDLELEVLDAKRPMSKPIHDLKRDLLTLRRAVWPQRDLVNALLRDDNPMISKDTRLYLRDTYDHAVQLMDMIETYRELSSGLMDLHLSGMSNRMNEIMKVLTIISTIFLPITAIAGIYGMNFHHESSPYNMPELDWYYGYPMVWLLMLASVVGLLTYYRRKGWLGKDDDGR
ncbi:magnesium transporter [Sorangium cellulosum]|uniref:Magnesium transport protein CorA n=1 Tax=Sorangium cellulosum TaxID=56 RepID=A0A2L0F500_SORCE|nr:magnesium/cobalt transporter CorA [Sorangium cellulosum]AUX46645.1 magnesium transporter [Sorangium cellulosum]